jgi:hypothetical protein
MLYNEGEGEVGEFDTCLEIDTYLTCLPYLRYLDSWQFLKRGKRGLNYLKEYYEAASRLSIYWYHRKNKKNRDISGNPLREPPGTVL